MPGTILLDDLRSSVEDQLHQHVNDVLGAAQQAASAVVQPVQAIGAGVAQAVQAPLIQPPSQEQVLGALQQHVDNITQPVQQAAQAVQQAPQQAMQVLGQPSQPGGALTQLGQTRDQVLGALNQHVDNITQAAQQVPQGLQDLSVPKPPAPEPPAATTALGGDQGLGGSGDAISQPSTAPSSSAPPDRSMGLQDYARAVAQRAGIDPAIFTAQIQQESGFDPKAKSPAGAIGIAQFMPGTAAGMNVDPTDPYAALDAAAQMDAQNLKKYGGDYSKTLAAYNAGGGAVDQYGGVPPYKETQSYVSTILNNAKTAVGDAASAVGGAASSLGTAAQGAAQAVGQKFNDISQFGDKQLSADEAYSACGPAAAVRFAERFGRNPTLREATDLAKQVGWTSGGGMAGIASEQALLKNMGVDTHIVTPDWLAIAKEAQTGNPVTISTPGHYYFADGYNPDTGAFHVGQSGLDLKHGAEWMTPQQMESLMGRAQGALFADNPNVPAKGASGAALGGTSGQQQNAAVTLGGPQAQPVQYVHGALQDAQGNTVADNGPTAIQSAQDVLGGAAGAVGGAVGGAASALGTAAQAVAKQVTAPVVLGAGQVSARDQVGQVANDLAQAAQGPIQAVQDLNRQTPGTTAVNAAAPVLGAAANELGTTSRNVVDQAAPVLGAAASTAADLATGGITRRFNENLQEVGQGLAAATPDLSKGVAPILGGAASALETTARNLPKDAPALAGILDITAAQLAQPGVLDAIQTRQELNDKYANTPGAQTIRDANGQQIVLSVDSSVMTPEDKTKYDQTGFVIGSISGPVEREGGLPTRSGRPEDVQAAQARQAGEAQGTVSAADAPTVGSITSRFGARGEPGMRLEGADTAVPAIVYRDADGVARGGLNLVHDADGNLTHITVAVDPAFQRQGIATAMYDAAKKAGYDVESVSGASGYTEAGAALTNARRAAPEATPANPYDLPRSAPEPTAVPLSSDAVLSHLEQLDQQHTQNDARIAELQNQVVAGTAVPEARAELARLQADRTQIDAAHTSIWDHAGSGGDVYARLAAEPLPSQGGVDAGAAQAARGPAPAPATATGSRGEARTSLPGPPGAPEPVARPEPAAAELTGFRAPEAGAAPAGAAGREPPYTPPVQNLSDVHSNPHLLREAGPGETPMTVDERLAHQDTLKQRYQANQDRLAAIDEQLRNPGKTPERPPWGAGWTNDQLTSIARAHGESAYAPLWWEKAGLDVGSGEVRQNVGEGGFRNPNAGRDATPTELRAERNQIAQEQRDLQAAGDQQATAPDNARFVRRSQTTADLPFERGADGAHGPHAVEQPNDTPGAVAADLVTKNGTKDYGNPLQEGPGQVIGRKGEVTGRGITDAEAANVGEPSAQTKHLMPNLDAMLEGEMPEVRAQIQKAAEDNPELMAAYQQGRISRDSVMTDLATKVGMSKADWLKTPVGKGFSTPELAALQAAAIDAQHQSKKLAGDIVAKGGVDALTPEEVAHSLSTLVDNSRLLAVARGGRASAGRSLNILKQKLDATMAQGINASNERIAALRVKSQAQAAVKRATQQLEQSKALDDEKRTVTARAQATGAPKNIVDQIAEAYDQLDRYQAMTLHEKADDFNALQKARDEAAAKRQAAVREPPQELLSALKAELAAERTNFAKRKDTWETMAFWDSKANEQVAQKRNAFRGGLYIEQYRKAADLAAKRADQEATRAWDLESRRQGVQRDKASALLEAVGGEKPTRELLDNYVKAINSDDPMVAAKFIKGLQDPGWWGKSQILRIAGLLSSTTTHLVNMVGNVTQAPLTLAEHALVVPIDWARSSLTGGERQAYMAELGPMAGSWGHGTLAALPDAIKILQTGITPEQAAKVAGGKVGRPGFASGSGAVDAAVEMPLRLLSAEDQLFRGGAFAMQSQRVATNYATKEGFRGKALEGRVSTIIANLESYPDLYTQANKATDRMLFQERRSMPMPGGLPSTGVAGEIMRGGVGQVLPFIKTPGNITAQGFGLSPFGAGGVAEALANRRNLRPEQLGQQTLLTEQRAARALIGTGIMGAGMALGAGVFTGGKSALTGAYDSTEASTYPQGYREWSLAASDPVSGNTYYIPFQNFGAAGAPLAMAAILTDAGRRGKQVIDGDEAVKASTAIGQYILDNTFLQGLSDTVNVLHDPTRYAPQFVQGLVSSYGPYSAMARQVQRSMGVASRNPHDGFMGLVDAMEANYPGLSGNVPEATSPLGDPRTQGISGAATFALPVRADISRDEPTLAALRAADVAIPAAPKAISVGNGWSIQLTEAEQDQIKRARGVLIRDEVANVLASPKYQAAVRANDTSTMNEYLRKAISNAAQNSNVDFQRSMTKEQLQARAERKAAPEPYILAGAA